MKAWGTPDGVPMVSVRSLAQTPDGYIWFGTFKGIGRFDGSRVQRLRMGSVAGIERDWFVCQWVDRRGRLWAGTENGAVLFENQQWRTLCSESGWTPQGTAISVAELSDGKMVFGCERGVQVWDGARFTPMPTPPKLAKDASGFRVAVDGQGALFSVADSTFCAWNGAEWTPLLTAPAGESVFATAAPARDGGLWVARADRILRWRDGAVTGSRPVPEPLVGDQAVLLEDRAGRLWAAFHYRGVVVYFPDGTTRSMTEADGLPNTQMTSLLEDREGNIFAGTGGGGAVQFTEKRVCVIGGRDAESGLNIIESVARDGSSMIRLDALGFMYQSAGEGAPKTELATPPCSCVMSILRARDGSLYAGTRVSGLWRYRDGAWTHPPGLPRTWSAMRVLFEDSAGRIWCDIDEGFGYFDGERIVQYTSANHPMIAHAKSFAEDAFGRIWIATSQRSFPLDREMLKPIPEEAVDGSASWIGGDRSGALWISLASGELLRRTGRDIRRIGPAEGWRSGEISSALFDDHLNAWCATQRGIIVLRRGELDAVCEGRAQRLFPVTLDRHDGLIDDSCAGASQPRAAKLENGCLAFATPHGVAVVDPNAMVFRPAIPGLRVESIEVDGKPFDAPKNVQSIQLPAGSKHVSARVGYPATTRGDLVRFEVTDDFGTRLHEAQGTFFSLEGRNLTPRTYEWRVRAFNADGLPAEKDLSIAFEVPPFWWQTEWFDALLSVTGVCAAAAVAWMMQDRRVRRHLADAQRQREFAAERARSESVLRHTHDIVVFADHQQSIFYANPAARALLEITAGRFSNGLTVESLLAPDSVAGWREAVARVDESGQPASVKLQLMNASNRPVPVDLSLQIHATSAGMGGFIAIVARDLRTELTAEAERKRLEEELRRAQKLEAVGTLAGGIAHDFNNSLSAVLGNAELALDDAPAGGETRRYLHQIVAAAQRARDLVRQILTFSKRQDSSPEVVDLADVARECAGMMEVTRPAGVELRAHYGERAWAEADRVQLHQVFANLLANAAQAIGGRRGTVTLRVERVSAADVHDAKLDGGEWIEVSVRDTGVGMDRETLARIYDPFFTTKPAGQGTGLGLAVVHGVVEKHHGVIAVRSTVGEGTAFHVYFRASDAPPRPKRADDAETSGEPTGQCALVVDDEPSVGRVCAMLLERAGFATVFVASPIEALAACDAAPERFSLVVTDLTMPQMSGLELARRLHDRIPSMPILITTGRLAGALTPDELAAAGVAGVLEKPYTLAALARLARAAARPAVGVQ